MRRVSVGPDIPPRVAQASHDIDDLYELQAVAKDSLNKLAGQQQRLGNRVEEVQQTLGLHGGRLDRIEGNQGRQSDRLEAMSGQLTQVSEQLTEVLEPCEAAATPRHRASSSMTWTLLSLPARHHAGASYRQSNHAAFCRHMRKC